MPSASFCFLLLSTLCSFMCRLLPFAFFWYRFCMYLYVVCFLSLSSAHDFVYIHMPPASFCFYCSAMLTIPRVFICCLLPFAFFCFVILFTSLLYNVYDAPFHFLLVCSAVAPFQSSIHIYLDFICFLFLSFALPCYDLLSSFLPRLLFTFFRFIMPSHFSDPRYRIHVHRLLFLFSLEYRSEIQGSISSIFIVGFVGRIYLSALFYVYARSLYPGFALYMPCVCARSLYPAFELYLYALYLR